VVHVISSIDDESFAAVWLSLIMMVEFYTVINREKKD